MTFLLALAAFLVALVALVMGILVLVLSTRDAANLSDLADVVNRLAADVQSADVIGDITPTEDPPTAEYQTIGGRARLRVVKEQGYHNDVVDGWSLTPQYGTQYGLDGTHWGRRP